MGVSAVSRDRSCLQHYFYNNSSSVRYRLAKEVRSYQSFSAFYFPFDEQSISWKSGTPPPSVPWMVVVHSLLEKGKYTSVGW